MVTFSLSLPNFCSWLFKICFISDIDFIERACQISPPSALPENLVTIPVITTTRTLRPTTTYDCTFETGFCIWERTTDSTFNWTRAQGQSSSQNAGPISVDHTLGTSDGWYAFANLINRKATDIARLESTRMSGPRCLEFYYYFYTNLKYKFNLFLKKDNQIGAPIWSRENSNANFWRIGRVTVQSGTGVFTLLFELKGDLRFGTFEDRIAIE